MKIRPRRLIFPLPTFDAIPPRHNLQLRGLKLCSHVIGKDKKSLFPSTGSRIYSVCSVKGSSKQEAVAYSFEVWSYGDFCD